MSKILTIAIPTYNRNKYLKILLDNIESKVKELKEYVDVVICDNCSHDETFTLVNRYIDSGFEINYIRNSENIGAVRNVIKCFEIAKTKYVWICGDDDIIPQKTINKVVEIITKDEYGVINLTPKFYSKTYNLEYLKDGDLNINKYEDKIDFFRDVNIWFTFLSVNIVNKDIIQKDFSPSEFDDKLFPHLAWILPAALSSDRNLKILDVSLVAKQGNTGGYALAKSFGIGLEDVFKFYIEKGYPDKYFKEIRYKLITDFFPINIYFARKDKKFEKEDYFSVLYPIYHKYLNFYIFILPAIYFPIPILFIWIKFLSGMLKIFRKMGVNI